MSKRAGAKSIIASFGSFSSATPEDASSESKPGTDVQRPVARVGAGIIGATQRSLAEIREERDRLQALVAKGGSQEIDPSLIDPSPFPDRLPDDTDEESEELKRLLRDEGQKVPIQVRAHPTSPGRYQVVYGHRRWRAALDLGLPVKALVTDLSDSELVIAQGIENSSRQDLSWIERSLFAWRMDKEGIKPRDIKAALGIDDAELARLRQVPKVVPLEVIQAIGRAPKAGRPRWISLANATANDDGAVARIQETLSADKVSSSDERFRRALAAALGKATHAENSDEMDLRDANGVSIGKAVFKSGKIRLRVAKDEGEAFSDFLRDELPGLVDRFRAKQSRS